MSCIASYLPPDEDKTILNIIQATNSTSTQPGHVHPALKYTGVKLTSQLDEWIVKNNQQILSKDSFSLI